MLIWNQLKARAAAHPDKRALACGDLALTYAQFAAQAERVATRGCGKVYNLGIASPCI